MHSFEPVDAEKYGILEAVLLSNIRWWVTKNASNNKHWYDGHYWTYNSAKAFAKMFPYASQQQIQRALKKLESTGILIVSNYNSNPYDHTKWYTTPVNGDFDRSHLINRDDLSDQPSNTDINTDISSVFDKKFEDFWTAYPKKVGKKNSKAQFVKLKPDDEMFGQIMRGLMLYKQTEQVKTGYIRDPERWIRDRRWEDEHTISQKSYTGLEGSI